MDIYYIDFSVISPDTLLPMEDLLFELDDIVDSKIVMKFISMNMDYITDVPDSCMLFIDLNHYYAYRISKYDVPVVMNQSSMIVHPIIAREFPDLRVTTGTVDIPNVRRWTSDIDVLCV